MRKIGSWIDFINRVNFESEIEEINEESNKFYNLLGEYFANIVKGVYFENKSWDVKSINLVKKCYIIEKRNPILFLDIGTGHTALNALMSKLKQNYGEKKKILLFDEIGDMDENNINRLIKEIREQINQGHVLFALLSQADNSKDQIVMESLD